MITIETVGKMKEKHYVYCLCQYNDELDSKYIVELYVPKNLGENGMDKRL